MRKDRLVAFSGHIMIQRDVPARGRPQSRTGGADVEREKLRLVPYNMAEGYAVENNEADDSPEEAAGDGGGVSVSGNKYASGVFGEEVE